MRNSLADRPPLTVITEMPHGRKRVATTRIQNTEWHLLRSLPFQGLKSLDFQGPYLPMALEMDFPASKSLRPAPYNKTGTFIVILSPKATPAINSG